MAVHDGAADVGAGAAIKTRCAPVAPGLTAVTGSIIAAVVGGRVAGRQTAMRSEQWLQLLLRFSAGEVEAFVRGWLIVLGGPGGTVEGTSRLGEAVVQFPHARFPAHKLPLAIAVIAAIAATTTVFTAVLTRPAPQLLRFFWLDRLATAHPQLQSGKKKKSDAAG